MNNHDALSHTLTAHTALSEHSHIDDAVDRLVERIGWDNAFQTMAAMDESRASMGMYSLICGLLIGDSSS